MPAIPKPSPANSRTVPAENTSNLVRECFVTIGATASFTSLLDETSSPSFLETLLELGYTHLTVQCGPELAYFNAKPSNALLESLHLKAFDFNKEGLGQEMSGCKKKEGVSKEGVVVCHAGAGTILDAMRIDVPIIVVPNPALLDNHQSELAEELEKQGYVTYGDLRKLSAALRQLEKKGKERTGWPPVNNGADPTGKGLLGVLDEEMGYEARIREILD